jgi:hypothetical protein
MTKKYFVDIVDEKRQGSGEVSSHTWLCDDRGLSCQFVPEEEVEEKLWQRILGTVGNPVIAKSVRYIARLEDGPEP